MGSGIIFQAVSNIKDISQVAADLCSHKYSVKSELRILKIVDSLSLGIDENDKVSCRDCYEESAGGCKEWNKNPKRALGSFTIVSTLGVIRYVGEQL